MDLIKFLYKQKEWSYKTFGPDKRTKGVINHIKKEIKEVEQDPTNLMERVDLILLVLDGTYRQGYTPEEITEAIEKKLEINMKRQWPDWKQFSEDIALEHIE